MSQISLENSTIYKLEKGIMTLKLKAKEIDRPNGLYMENERLMVGSSGDGTLKGIHLADKKIQSIAKVGSTFGAPKYHYNFEVCTSEFNA